VERCRQRSNGDNRISSAWFEEVEAREPVNFVFNSTAAIKVNKVRATTQQHMLTVVHHLASSGMLIRRCPSAKIRTSLKQLNSIASFRQCASGSKARKSTTDNGYRLFGFGRHEFKRYFKRFANPFVRTFSFSLVVSRTFSPKTL
jgi:hypothetical protein